MYSRFRRCAILGLTLLLLACGQEERTPARLDLRSALGGSDLEGYARATAPRPFAFPRDHGAHPEFRSEWWYVTGNLSTEDKAEFGYQITFFRLATSPEAAPRRSNWGTNQTWMAHVALSDLGARTHHKEERFARGAAGLAGVELHPFRVWLEDWEMAGADDLPWRIRADTRDFALDLRLTPKKPIVLQGDRGLSQKSPEPGNASYYYSITRLQTQGPIRVGDRHVRRRGTFLARPGMEHQRPGRGTGGLGLVLIATGRRQRPDVLSVAAQRRHPGQHQPGRPGRGGRHIRDIGLR